MTESAPETPKKKRRPKKGPWNQSVMFSSARTEDEDDETSKDNWITPPDVFEELNDELGFGLDVAALANTARVDNYLGPDHEDPLRRDALSADWSLYANGRPSWDNPPYSEAGAFLRMANWHAANRNLVSGNLVFARTETKWWWKYVLGRDPKTRQRVPDRLCAAEIRWRSGRITFLDPATGAPRLDSKGRPQTAPAPSVFIIYRPGYTGLWPENGVF